MDTKLRSILFRQKYSKVKFSFHPPYRDFCNGFLVAEIISRYYPLYVQMHSFDNSTRYAKKKDNWQQIHLILKSLRAKEFPIELSVDNVEDLIQNNNSATIVFMKKLYTQLAQRQLAEMPKMASVKDKSAQWEGTFILKDKELVKLSEQEDDFFKTEEAKAEKDSTEFVVSEIEDKPQPAAKKEDIPPEQIKSIRLPKGPQKPITTDILREAIAV